MIMKEEIANQIRQNLIEFDTIQNKYRLNGENPFLLLCGTVAQESNFLYKRQRIKTSSGKIEEKGEGCSYFQIEAATALDILYEYVRFKKADGGFGSRPELEKILNRISTINLDKRPNKETIQNELLNNFKFATFIARLAYYRQPFSFKIYKSYDEKVKDYAQIWKKYFNTIKGAGTIDQFINNYSKFKVDDLL